MPLTSKEAIQQIKDRKVIKVFVPAWNDHVFIRTMTGFERDHMEAVMLSDEEADLVKRLENFRARLAVICLSDEEGSPIFTEKDAWELGQKSAAALSVIANAIQELNGITPSDQEKIVKNSGSTPSSDGDSPSV